MVGVMSSVVEIPADQASAKLRRFGESQGREMPRWSTERLITTVSECIRRLPGRWKATPYGKSIEVLREQAV
jgi:hypothetical protein